MSFPSKKRSRLSYCDPDNPCKYCVDYSGENKLKQACEMHPQPSPRSLREKREKSFTLPIIRTREEEIKYETLAYTHIKETNGLVTREAMTYSYHVKEGWKSFSNEKKAIDLFLKKYNNLGRYWLVWKKNGEYKLLVFLEKQQKKYLKKYEKLRKQNADNLEVYEGVKTLFEQNHIPQCIVKRLIQKRIKELWKSMDPSDIEKEEHDHEIK